MELQKTVRDDKMEVVSQGDWYCVQVRTPTIESEEGTELSKSYQRHVVMPNVYLSAEDADVSAICTTVFTQAGKDAYAAHLAAQEE